MTLNKQAGGVKISFRAEGYPRTVWLAKDDLLTEHTIEFALKQELTALGIEKFKFSQAEIAQIKQFEV